MRTHRLVTRELHHTNTPLSNTNIPLYYLQHSLHVFNPEYSSLPVQKGHEVHQVMLTVRNGLTFATYLLIVSLLTFA